VFLIFRKNKIEKKIQFFKYEKILKNLLMIKRLNELRLNNQKIVIYFYYCLWLQLWLL